MRQDQPTFLIVGAARGGTTALAVGLRGHPDVFLTDPKEPHYFAYHGERVDHRGPEDDTFVNNVAVTDEASYRSLYRGGTGHRARGEGSASTLYHYQHAIPEILRLDPGMKIVILLREPVSRAHSSYQYLRGLGVESEDDFLAAVAAETQRVDDNWHHLWRYTRMSMYAEAVTAFRDAFPAHQLGIHFYDDLQDDFDGILTSVFELLDVPPDWAPSEKVDRVNVSGRARFPAVQRTVWWVTGRPVLRTAVRRLTTYRIRERVRGRLMSRTDVPDEVAEALAPRFYEDLVALRDLLRPLVGKRSLPSWLETPAGGTP